MGMELVGDEHFWATKPFHSFAQKLQRGLAIPALGNEAFQHLAFMIDCPPQIVPFAIDLHKHLVQMPLPVRMVLPSQPAFPYLGRKMGTEPVPPKPNCFMADVDPAFVKKIFNIPERKRKSDIHRYR